MHLIKRSWVLAAAVIGTTYLPASQAEDWDKVVAAAEKEGKLTLLGPVIQPYRQAIEQFQKAYPKIQLQYTGVTSPEFEARVRSERRVNRYLWDVTVLGFSGSAFTQQLPEGWFDPIRPLIVKQDVLADQNWLGGFAAGFLDKKQQYIFAFQAGKQNNVNIDRSVVPESELSSLEDLLNPKWKGKIAILDPRTRGSGHLITLLQTALGADKARQFLTEQQPVIASTNRQLADWVAQGAYPITSGLSPSEIATLKDQGLAKTVNALQTTPEQTAWTPGWGAIALLHQPPHPNASKVFINWFLSQPAQEDWAKRGFVNSRRTDVAPGLAASALTADAFHKGVTFNSEENADKAQQATELAQKAMQ
ncbi:extracellular solute-binding protein [Pseudomonas sp. 21LCFQ02]|uniref:ABC transporter substrate-binding protein n=1 Tax=Pseudomonas sp. 21LCFQ02 TaxID=2957505 RepID=UPI00209A7B26|nr:extracellular solute-binding protein [Pseudomonas sp. 21LCFQ02]MCO8167516.1 extracellular solute-binding protein [Pseudomonas sp. 21LCFQ02]